MQYYVIGPDGAKYGPADVPTLKQWAAENRLNPDAVLEDFNTGQRTTAAQVAGIFEPGAPGAPIPSMTPTTDAQRGQMSQQLPSGSAGPSLYDSPAGNMAPGYYQRQGQKTGNSNELTVAWCFAILSLVCCGLGWIFGPLAIWQAGVAANNGNPNASGPKIVGIIGTVLGVVVVIARVIVLMRVLPGLQQ